jgi:hypothetical protein
MHQNIHDAGHVTMKDEAANRGGLLMYGYLAEVSSLSLRLRKIEL